MEATMGGIPVQLHACHSRICLLVHALNMMHDSSSVNVGDATTCGMVDVAADAASNVDIQGLARHQSKFFRTVK
jgi:hypothetical protein